MSANLITFASLSAIAAGRAMRCLDVGPRLARRLGCGASASRSGVVVERLLRGGLLYAAPRWAGYRGEAPAGEEAPNADRSRWFVLGFGSVTAIGAALHARTPEAQASYPRMQVERWDALTHALNAGSWTLYLLSYEAMFRRTLRVALRAHLPAPAAEVAAVLVYGLDHAPMNRNERLGSLLMGPALSAAARWTGSTRPIALGHAIMAIASDVFTLRARSAAR